MIVVRQTYALKVRREISEKDRAVFKQQTLMVPASVNVAAIITSRLKNGFLFHYANHPGNYLSLSISAILTCCLTLVKGKADSRHDVVKRRSVIYT